MTAPPAPVGASTIVVVATGTLSVKITEVTEVAPGKAAEVEEAPISGAAAVLFGLRTLCVVSEMGQKAKGRRTHQ